MLIDAIHVKMDLYSMEMEIVMLLAQKDMVFTETNAYLATIIQFQTVRFATHH
jgi:hypothetical protein